MAVGRISPSRETPDFTREQRERYRRQMVIPEVGEAGQSKLRDARVCLVGLGGLGSVSAMYLAAAGVGRLCAVDRDRVELGNLNRQVIHWTKDLGEAKAESARRKLGALNPEVHLEILRADVTDATISELASGCSVIVDATDNLQTRKAINRFSVQEGIPFVVGGVNGFHGMVTTVIPGISACLECIFPGRAPGGEEEIGVLGPLPGIVASIQALETIKLICGAGRSLAGRLLLIDGLEMSFREVRTEPDPNCKVCGPGPQRGKADEE
jgi:adenylyltransferase/sulfurtransferase